MTENLHEMEYYNNILECYEKTQANQIQDFEVCAYRQVLGLIHEERTTKNSAHQKDQIDSMITNMLLLILSLRQPVDQTYIEKANKKQKSDNSYLEQMMGTLL